MQSEFNNEDLTKASKIFFALQKHRPATKEELKNYIKVFLGIDVPDKKICPEHNSPLEYLWHSFNSDFILPSPAGGDCVIWANRGGGKTEIAAAAALLHSIFKSGCQTRILAGSGEQAGRMYDYLTGFIGQGFDCFLAKRILADRCCFKNGSAVEVLMQSQTSVRGQHVQKLLCDEVELFDPAVFAAAKFTTISRPGIIPAMEIISTMHLPYGLMHRIVTDAQKCGTPVFKWCIWETIEKCTDRNCSACPLWGDCGGRAKEANGFLKVDDCITIMKRSSRQLWETEMLCRRPSLESVVFDEFEPSSNVRQIDYNPNLLLYRAIDFGFVNPFVCLWIQTDGEGNIFVIDEYIRSRAAIQIHAEEIKKRTPCSEEKTAGTFCDPAGESTDSNGTSAARQLRQLGIQVRYRRSGIIEGIELIRQAIRSADGKRHLFISPRCPRLIEAMQCYHYPEGNFKADKELPLKDGVYDHPIDALRYFFINYKYADVKLLHRRY